jgi:hypothetical protein
LKPEQALYSDPASSAGLSRQCCSPLLVRPLPGLIVVLYFFFVFFAAFGFAAAFVVGFFALRFAVIGMRE